MARKLLIHRLPFEQVNGTTRAGRPRVPRVVLVCSDCGGPIERRVTDVQRDRAFGIKRAYCPQCVAQWRSRGVRPRRADTKIRTLDRVHNGRPVFIDYHGYIAVFDPTFSAATHLRSLPKGYHYEHRIVAVRKIGRPLRRSEDVHHVNGLKTDNRPENLQVVSRKQHAQIHADEIAAKLRRLELYEQQRDAVAQVSPPRVWGVFGVGSQRTGGFPPLCP